jgi:hypothetical protein
VLALVSIIAFAIFGLQTTAQRGGIVVVCVLYLIPALLFLLSRSMRRRSDDPVT